MAEVIDGILIREVETKNIMTKSSLPVGGYSVNPYVGCTHACKYCYASDVYKRQLVNKRRHHAFMISKKSWPPSILHHALKTFDVFSDAPVANATGAV